MPFDPKQYLQAGQAQAPKPGFDPNAYLAKSGESEAQSPQEMRSIPASEFDVDVYSKSKGLPTSQDYAGAMGSAAAGGPAAGLVKSAWGRIGRNAAIGGAASFGKEPQEDESRLGNAAKGASLSALLSSGGEGLTKLLGGSGDAVMQAAVGRKKYTPGVGETLAEEGIVGTKGMMGKQVDKRLAQRAGEMQQAAAEIPGTPFDSRKLAQSIESESARPFQVPGANPSAADMPKLEKIGEFASDVASRGMESGPQALARRMAAGQRGYAGKEDPLQSLLGQMSKREQVGYSQGLKSAHAEATGSPKLAEADKAYGALKRAQKSLAEEPTLPKSMFQLMSTGVNVVPGGSLGMSTLGQALVKGGKASKLYDPILRQKMASSDHDSDDWK